MISRGDIRWFRFDAPDKRRPVLVLGREDVLPSLTQIPVIPLSTQIRDLPWEVRAPMDFLAGTRFAGPMDRDVSCHALERGGRRIAERARTLMLDLAQLA